LTIAKTVEGLKFSFVLVLAMFMLVPWFVGRHLRHVP